jgi:hypothetical protein
LKRFANLLNFIDMAKNIGLIKFSGGLGDLVGYYRGKQYVIQRKGGATAARLKEDACYEDVRKRQTEFGKCSKISSMLKAVFEAYLRYIPTPMMYNWIQSQVMGVKNSDLASAKGFKTFFKGLGTEAGIKLFRAFEFNRNVSLKSVVRIEEDAVLDRGALVFSVVSPKVFEGFVMGASLVVLSVDFDAPSCSVYSNGLAIFDAFEGEISLTVDLPTEPGCWVAFLYVAKGKRSGGDFVWLRDRRNVLGVVDIKFV